MTCLSGSHSFQLFTCVLSGDHFTVFILFKRPARSRLFPTIDLAAVGELRNRMAKRQSAESDRETFGDRSGNSQQHRAAHVTAVGETTESVSGSRARGLEHAFAYIPVPDAPGAERKEPPSDLGVARAALERRRREGGQRRPRAAAVVSRVPDGLADLPWRAEIVMLVHVCAGARLVFRRHRRNGQPREANCRPEFAFGQETSWTA